jgi:predicted DNA-binding transcriptional regulator YafY
MSRSERLLDLIQLLRRHRRPVRGSEIAAELGVSLRTVYRDIQSLSGRGAPIEGAAGLGYVLRAGFTLPPLMFSEEEIEAVVLGSRMVAESADAPLARAARDALAKITAVLPGERRDEVASLGLLSAKRRLVAPDGVDLARLRGAIRAERKVVIQYSDEAGNRTERRVWPIALTFFDRVRLLAAWCELRQGFRHFRTDRIAGLRETEERFPRRRRALMKEWRAAEGVTELDC